MSIDEASEPSLGSLDTAPVPATPEELGVFKDIAIAKVRSSSKTGKRHDPQLDIEVSYAKWQPKEDTLVFIEIGTQHDPEAVDVLVLSFLGQFDEIDIQKRAHYRYQPGVGVAEYDENHVKILRGKRLVGQVAKRAYESITEVDNADLEKAKEHAKELDMRFKDTALPVLTKDQLDDVEALLALCSQDTEVDTPQFG